MVGFIQFFQQFFGQLTLQTAGALLLCYIIGAMPISVLLSRVILKKDLREVGSGNIGTSNAYRAGGFLFAFSVAAIDIGKGFVAVQYVLPDSTAALFATCFGQMFSLFLGFKGGKGVATYIGSLIGLNWQYGLSIALSWLAITKLLQMPFISSLLAVGASVLIFDIDYWVWVTICLIILKHRSNVIDFVKGLSKR